MKNRLFVTVLFLVASATFYAQEYKLGVKAGPNLSNVSGYLSETTNPRLGYHFGFFSEISFTDKFSVNPELYYNSIGYVFEFSENNRNVFNPEQQDLYFKTAQRLNYLTVPITLKFYINQKFSLEAGPQTSFLINAVSKLKEASDMNGVENRYSSSGDFRLDFGATLGIGYNLTDRTMLQLRYYYGLRNLFENNPADFKSYNQAIQLSVGYTFLKD